MLFKFTLKNILIAVYFFITIIITVILMIPAFILLITGGRSLSYRYINRLGKYYSRNLLFVSGAKIETEGLENIPEKNNICFVSNHQGLADIFLIVGYIPKTVGFIAKKELSKIPLLNIWIKAMGCIYIDRKNRRNSLKTIEKGIKHIRNGHPIVVFPEGTRSRSNKMNKFKSGSLKLITGANALVIPISINGTYNVIENNGKISSSKIRLIIHKPIDIGLLTDEKKQNLNEMLWKIINSGIN